MNTSFNIRFDCIVVGAGSAGCTLASRLVESGRSVLLLEAGGRDRNPMLHIPLASGHVVNSGKYNWNLQTEPSPGLDNRRVPYPRGKVLGGTSSINGMIYIRGNPADYDEYAALGNRGWSYREVLPYFKRSENHASRRNEFHGDEGPLRVTTGNDQNPLYDAFLLAGRQAGHPINDDFNGSSQEGFGRYDFTIYRGRRQSTATAFLPGASRRGTLTMVTQASVQQVIVEGGRASGIKYRHHDRSLTALADEVVLCCGTVHSPHLLMLSGIGAPDELERHGIEVRHGLPGVGKNLHDHARVNLQFSCTKPWTLHRLMRVDRIAMAMARAVLLRSGPAASFPAEAGGFTKIGSSDQVPEAQWYCVLGTLANRVRLADWPGSGKDSDNLFAIGTVLLRPESVGEIRLRSSNPEDQPLIYPNLLHSDNDLAKLVNLAQQAAALSSQPAFHGLIKPGSGSTDQLKGTQEWAQWVRRNVVTSAHPVGTCKMGNDRLAVVNDCLEVHGIKGLRVADASILPLVPRGNTNAPTIMVAEKAADFMLNG